MTASETESEPETPDTLFGVDPQVLILAIARMSESVGNSFLIVVLPLFIANGPISGGRLGLAEAAFTGLILALFGLVNSPLQPYVGRFSDRVARRKVFVLVGLVILAISAVAYSFTTSYWQLVGIRVFQGLGGALIIPTTVALVDDLATKGNRGGNMGTYNTFRLVGFGVGPITAGAVVGIDEVALPGLNATVSGFDLAFYLASATAIASFLLVWFQIRDPDIEPSDPDRESAGVDLRDASGKHLLDPVFTLGIITFIMALGIAVFATIGEDINAELSQGGQLFGLQFAAFVLAQIFLQTPIGRATDIYGRRRFIVVGMLLLVPTTLAQGLILDSAASVPFNSWMMFGARFAQGVAGAMVFAPALALAGDLAKEGESGSTLSVLTTAFAFGVAIGPLVSGFLVQLGLIVPFAIAAGLAAVGTVLVSTQVEEVITPTGRTSPAD